MLRNDWHFPVLVVIKKINPETGSNGVGGTLFTQT